MEEWRALAGRVPAILLPIANGTRTADFLSLANAAHDQLSMAVYKSHRALAGDCTAEEFAAIPMPPPGAPTTIALIDSARFELDRIMSEHGTAGRAFRLCATRFGIVVQDPGDPLWRGWETQRFLARRHATDALLALRDAAELCQATVNVHRLVMSYPPRSLGWRAWTAAGERLMRRAATAITAATVLVGIRLAGAVALENQHAWNILHG